MVLYMNLTVFNISNLFGLMVLPRQCPYFYPHTLKIVLKNQKLPSCIPGFGAGDLGLPQRIQPHCELSKGERGALLCMDDQEVPKGIPNAL